MRIKPSGSLIEHHTWSPLWDTVKAPNRQLCSIAIRPHPLVVKDTLAKECLPGDIYEADEDEVVRELPELVPEAEEGVYDTDVNYSVTEPIPEVEGDEAVAPVIELMEIRYE